MTGLWKFHCKNGKERGFLALYILHSLKNKPKSGYEILKEIEEKTKGKWIIKQRNIIFFKATFEQGS